MNMFDVRQYKGQVHIQTSAQETIQKGEIKKIHNIEHYKISDYSGHTLCALCELKESNVTCLSKCSSQHQKKKK